MRESKSVRIHDLVHDCIAGGESFFCSWPWTGGIHDFGNGEIVIAYTEKPCAYETIEDVEHGEGEARFVLCRTLDGGRTWPAELRQVVRDNTAPFDAWIREGGEAQHVDITGKDAMFLFWRSFVRACDLTPEGTTLRCQLIPSEWPQESNTRNFGFEVDRAYVFSHLNELGITHHKPWNGRDDGVFWFDNAAIIVP